MEKKPCKKAKIIENFNSTGFTVLLKCDKRAYRLCITSSPILPKTSVLYLLTTTKAKMKRTIFSDKFKSKSIYVFLRPAVGIRQGLFWKISLLLRLNVP